MRIIAASSVSKCARLLFGQAADLAARPVRLVLEGAVVADPAAWHRRDLRRIFARLGKAAGHVRASGRQHQLFHCGPLRRPRPLPSSGALLAPHSPQQLTHVLLKSQKKN